MRFKTEGSWTTWAETWLEGMFNHLSGQVEVEDLHVTYSGGKQLRLQLLLKGRSTLIEFDADATTVFEYRAEQLLAWLTLEKQIEMFDEADKGWNGHIPVERSAALAAAERISGEAFRDGMRSYITGTRAKVTKGYANITRRHKVLELDPGLIIKTRGDDGQPSVRLRNKSFILTHLTFTPKVEMELPRAILEALPGRPIEDVIDADVLKGGGLVISKVWTNPGNTRPDGSKGVSTSFEVLSDKIDIDEAVAIINQRRGLVPN